MSAPQKRSFSSFVKRTPDHLTEAGGRHDQAPAGRPDPAQAPASHSRPAEAGWPEERQPTPAQSERPEVDETGEGGDGRQRVRTSTGRVRTYSASRSLPGVTLRLSEERWERLKLLSVQERRPIQEILGEAMDAYMRGRGLRW